MKDRREGARGSSRFRAWRLVTAALLVTSSAGATAWGVYEVLPKEGAIARGVRVNAAPVEPGGSPTAVARAEARRLLERRIELRWDGERVLDVTPEDLGATIDEGAVARQLAAVGREGDVWSRIDDALEAREGRVNVQVRARIPVEELASRIARIKEERDSVPQASRLDFKTRTATPHTPGRYLDVYGAAEAIERALARSESAVDLPVLEIAPRASSDVVATIDVSQVVSKFETRFGYLGNQAGRAQNVTRAAAGMDGVVLMPGDVVSFNANVGSRSIENGFTTAPEIYKGEMREGIGGGTCQVASTLHAAAYLGGVDIVERINHSRPSGYIRMGLDATVVYPTVDLKLKNPYSFPVVLRAVIDKGQLTFELRGREQPVTVEWSSDTIGVAAFKRKVEEDPYLAAGKVVRKQKGIRGFTVKKKRVIHVKGGADRVEVMTDVYPPTFEIYRVAPGTDVETALPPLATDPASGSGAEAPATPAPAASAGEASAPAAPASPASATASAVLGASG